MASSSSTGRGPAIRPLSRRATRFFVIGLLVVTFVIALAGTLYLVRTAQEAQPQTTQDDASWQARLDAYIRYELESKGLPTLAIAVVDDQDFVWTKGYGLADPEREIPVTTETVYRVASVSKLFTALTVMQLVERGVLDLDAPITTYLPEFQPESSFETPITLRQLHSHRSGLVREPPIGHYFDPTEPSLETTVMSLNETALVYAPETRTKYSNAAVSVAGYVVERTQGEPYGDYVQRALLDPLGLKKTSFLPRADLRRDLGIGYLWRYDTKALTEAPVFELGIGPAANLYTTVSDLGRFVSALFAIKDGTKTGILRPETLEEMWTVQFAPPEEKAGFGLGFYVSDFQGHRRVQHSGVMYGYATRLYALPDRKLGLAIVANLDAVNPVVDRIGNYALSLLLAEKDGQPLPDFVPTDPIDPARARALDGRYVGSDVIDLVERDGRLFLDRKAPERLLLRTLGDTLVTDSRLGFGYRLVALGDTLVADDERYVRQPRERPPPIKDAWKGLIGEYGWDHNTLYVLERDGRLHTLIEWFFYYPLEEESDDVFLFPDGGLYMGEKLTFTRDETGRATQASLNGVVFKRRNVAPHEGNVFRIVPQRPIDELRAEALAASPPDESRDLRESDLVELTTLDPTIKLDIRYASANNFMGVPFYEEPRAFLQRPAAEALVRAHQDLKAHGFGLFVHDGYRPWQVTKMFFDATPDSLKLFVADPTQGSRHNRGCAVDLTLYDLATGAPVEMPSGYDEFTARAYPDYPGGTARPRYHREILRDAMEAHGFTVYEAEWWHFDYKDWREYPIMNVEFGEIGGGN